MELDDLRLNAGFWINEKLYQEILEIQNKEFSNWIDKARHKIPSDIQQDFNQASWWEAIGYECLEKATVLSFPGDSLQ